MSKRFYYDEFCEEIFDEEIQTYPSNQSICGILNKQAERIAELEEQLKNAIVPKFKIGQMVYTYNKYQDCVYILDLISVHIERYETSKFNSLVYMAKRLKDGFISGYSEEDLFATKEEAQAKLKELQGE